LEHSTFLLNELPGPAKFWAINWFMCLKADWWIVMRFHFTLLISWTHDGARANPGRSLIVIREHIRNPNSSADQSSAIKFKSESSSATFTYFGEMESKSLTFGRLKVSQRKRYYYN
jgi:hypothetical protein